MIEGIFVEGLIYGIMALGVFFTFRILDFPDLTVDGSFPLGAVIMAMAIQKGIGLTTGITLAFAGGVAAGAVTAVIHNKLKVPHLLAGILTMTMLYSVNIRILGNRANLPLMRKETLLSKATAFTNGTLSETWTLLLLFILVVLVIKVLMDLFFHTDMGLTFGAMGGNTQMVISQGVNPATYKVIGVGLSNGLVALSGAFAAQYQGFADINLGQGIVVSGLASVMIGEFLIRSNRISMLTLRVIIGAIFYKAIMFLGRYYGYTIHLTPNDLKLVSGVLIIGALVVTQMKKPTKGAK
ncbi:ABC transporter permease [Desulfoluna limicola]|uniref:ABC transporter permease n=1 Tax=Desulfoluna limicola TaxID=2810562 RepID=A0ABN6F7F5_9BACT|nr:ABC transporter permease [Desulfoluna limicola]BCS97665.1 ABC transporter permease [Desulfoluna limicola]